MLNDTFYQYFVESSFYILTLFTISFAKIFNLKNPIRKTYVLLSIFWEKSLCSALSDS